MRHADAYYHCFVLRDDSYSVSLLDLRIVEYMVGASQFEIEFERDIRIVIHFGTNELSTDNANCWDTVDNVRELFNTVV